MSSSRIAENTNYIQKALNFYEGLTALINASTLNSMLNNPRIPDILRESFSTNVPPLLGYIAAKFVEKQISYYLPHPIAEHASYGINAITKIGFVYYFGSTFYRNTLINVITTNAVPPQPNKEKRDSDNELTKTLILSPPIYGIQAIGINTIQSLHVLRHAVPYIQMLHFGRSLLENLYMDMSIENQETILKQLNSYAFGLGLSFYITEQLFAELIYRTTGVNNDFAITYFISASLYPLFIATTLLKTPPTKEEHGYDLFWLSHSRLLLKNFLEQLNPAIMLNFLNKPKGKFDWASWIPAAWIPWISWIQQKGKEKYNEMVDNFFSDKLHTLLFDIYYDKFQQKLNMANFVQSQPFLMKIAKGLPSFLVSETNKKLVTFIEQDELKSLISFIRKTLEKIRIKQSTLRQEQLDQRTWIYVDESNITTKNHKEVNQKGEQNWEFVTKPPPVHVKTTSQLGFFGQNNLPNRPIEDSKNNEQQKIIAKKMSIALSNSIFSEGNSMSNSDKGDSTQQPYQNQNQNQNQNRL